MRPFVDLICVALTVASLARPSVAKKTKAAPGVFEALENAGASQFGVLVRETPELLDLLIAGEIGHLFAPSDSTTSHSLKPRHAERRATNTSSQSPTLQAVLTNSFQALEDIQSGSSKARAVKRSVAHSDTSSSNFGFVVETAQDANLNDNSGQNLVVQPWQDSTPDKSTSEDGDLAIIAKVYSGLGNIVEVLKGTFKFARCANKTGTIFVTKDYFTVPERLCSTAVKLNLTTFISLVKCSGLSEVLDTKPSITVFIPSNQAYEDAGVLHPDHAFSRETAEKVKALVVPNYLGYTPNLMDGQTLTSMNGTKIEILIEDGEILVNGGRIIKRDIILENGVAHVIDKAFSCL
ncbi:FAS1 domain-containing protein [Cercophora newfieldiana]|uniref:FAS1 domain-containing protein n=1 Tax=Cercophora newfieldiana TaxID=92897 RepID=A0AA39YD21_9PEZI|nr:FAS1 domain-containing protein [Cercophora newfieldiana]